jgi:hypothetical protein
LKLFIDGLNLIPPIDRLVQDRIVMADIGSIVDLGRLRLVQDASEDSYPTCSSKVSEVIEASELGTTDRRMFEGRVRDMQQSPSADAPRRESTDQQQPASKVKGEVNPHKIFARDLLTPKQIPTLQAQFSWSRPTNAVIRARACHVTAAPLEIFVSAQITVLQRTQPSDGISDVG